MKFLSPLLVESGRFGTHSQYRITFICRCVLCFYKRRFFELGFDWTNNFPLSLKSLIPCSIFQSDCLWPPFKSSSPPLSSSSYSSLTQQAPTFAKFHIAMASIHRGFNYIVLSSDRIDFLSGGLPF
jgi:hypothetical protein